MDYGRARADGIDFATHKATEGPSTVHSHLAAALERAGSAGIPVLGAYHVVRTRSISRQVSHFLGTLDRAVPWWRSHPAFMLQVDLEIWEYDRVTAATGVQFIRALQAAAPGAFVVLYASNGQYGEQLGAVGVPLWNANYGSNLPGWYRDVYPGDRSSRWGAYSGQAPAFLQYGSRTRIGSQSTCDANAFRGTVSQLVEMVGGGHVTWQNGIDECGPIAGTNEFALYLRHMAEQVLNGGQTPGAGDNSLALQLAEIRAGVAGLVAAQQQVLTDEQVAALALRVLRVSEAVSAAVSGVVQVDSEVIAEAVKVALREGTDT
jgi:hypothetical protein